MGRIVGIDLGTTNSVVAALESRDFRILENKEGTQATRSIVCSYRGELLVGNPALNRWALAPEDTIISIKRLMGRAISDPEVERVKKKYLYKIVQPSDGTKDSIRIKMEGKEYSPVDISAMILRKLKKDAEYRLGEEVTHAVITVPAYFNDKQRYATKQAGKKAGLTVMKLLSEPNAAAVAFDVESGEEESKIIIVYDLGGGTFDVSVLLVAAGAYAALNLEGDMWLGGDNFDQVIVDHVIDYVKKEYNIDATKNKRFMVELQLKAKEAKETLSASKKADVIIPGILRDSSDNLIDVIVDITREEYESMIKPLVNRANFIVKKAVENAKLKLEDIDYVLMAGNSTLIPAVQQSMEELFDKKKVLRKTHPKNCVALGAAKNAVTEKKVVCDECGHKNKLDAEKCEECGKELTGLTEKEEEALKDKDISISFDGMDIAAFPYGVIAVKDNNELEYSVFINKGDEYPTPEEDRNFQTFETGYPNQRWVSIPVYGGDNFKEPRKNDKQGEALAILPPNLPEGSPIHIKLWLNKDGFFEIKARLEDKTELNPWILRGEIDQKTYENIIECEEKFKRKENSLKNDEKNKAKNLFNEILDHLKDKKSEEANKKVEELSKYLDSVGPDGGPLIKQAEAMIKYINFLIKKYDWLMGRAAVQLEKISIELEKAVNKKDTALIKQNLNELNNEYNKLMTTKDSKTGKPVPTYLGAFTGFRFRINSQIYPVKPGLAQKLSDKLLTVEEAFRTRDPGANQKFALFTKELMDVLKECPDKSIKCPHCGYLNPPDAYFCQKCNHNLMTIRKGT